MEPCWSHVCFLFRRQSPSGAPFGLPIGPCCCLFCLLRCLLLPRWRHCRLIGPFLLFLRSHLLLSDSIFGVRVALICSFSRSALRPSVFFHAPHSNQLASSLVTIKVLHRQSEVSRKYVAKNALLAHSSCLASAALTSSVYIYIRI